jgi:hypothetical protein
MEDNSEVFRKGRLRRDQLNRLGRLLNMMYKPSEISEEIGFKRRQFYRVYIPAGCPHVRDEIGHLWINGKDFEKWIRKTYKKHEVKQNQAFCLTCRKAVPMIEPKKIQGKKLQYYQCVCPNCGRTLAKIITVLKG